tara:strand:+ start:2594 stop:3094 length:501 start_codon:yes stop_codon:yes gene_type:complete
MACVLPIATKTEINDCYMTPNYAWENIKEYIPKDKIIWEPFMGDGQSGDCLRELGFDVVHNDEDFFTSNEGEIVVSNPPFSKSKEIITRLKELNKPFILILPSNKINTQYFRILKNEIQIIIPKKRIHFQKLIDGEVPTDWKNACFFDCFYYCYKMNLPKDINWLD